MTSWIQRSLFGGDQTTFSHPSKKNVVWRLCFPKVLLIRKFTRRLVGPENLEIKKTPGSGDEVWGFGHFLNSSVSGEPAITFWECNC